MQRFWFPGLGLQGVKIFLFPLRIVTCLAEWERQEEIAWGKEKTENPVFGKCGVRPFDWSMIEYEAEKVT